jgi:hypothetical protein
MSFPESSVCQSTRCGFAPFEALVNCFSNASVFSTKSWAAFPFAFAICLVAASIPATVTPAVAAKNSIGKASLSQRECQETGLANGSCYRVLVSGCAQATRDFAAVVKINEAPNPSQLQGTVFFTTGGDGNAFYDYDQDFIGDPNCSSSNCGMMVVQSINAANYRTVQINFMDPEGVINEPDGWLTGPASDGPRALACRYATVVHAVWSILLQKDVAQPVCATGNSGGGALIAYAITQYNMGNSSGPGPMFALAEVTSGPPYGRIDHGCSGSSAPNLSVACPAGDIISENYGLDTAESFVDPAYPTAVCSADINSNGKDVDRYFYHDSVLSNDFPAPAYRTIVRALFGSEDLSSAVPLGIEWYDAITSVKSAACISGAPHELPENFAGATAIVNDITAYCK